MPLWWLYVLLLRHSTVTVCEWKSYFSALYWQTRRVFSTARTFSPHVTWNMAFCVWSWPIRADLAFQEGGLREAGTEWIHLLFCFWVCNFFQPLIISTNLTLITFSKHIFDISVNMCGPVDIPYSITNALKKYFTIKAYTVHVLEVCTVFLWALPG